MLHFHIDPDRCVRCGECVADCPSGIITLDDIPVITDENACIRCQHCLAVCPEGAVSIFGHNPDLSVSLEGAFPAPASMVALIKGRRSIRRYKDENLDPALIDELLNTACHAPTGVNAQNVLFTVIKDRAVMAALRNDVLEQLTRLKDADELPQGLAGQYMGWAVSAWNAEGKDIIFRGAPHMVLTSAPKTAPCPVQDVHIALATFDLLAQAEGLGTLWDGLFMMALALCPEAAARLAIPADHTLGYALLFGKPAAHYYRTVQRGPAKLNIVK